MHRLSVDNLGRYMDKDLVAAIKLISFLLDQQDECIPILNYQLTLPD